MTQRISHHFCLTQMVQNLTVIILHYVQPSQLPHIKIGLIHQILQTLVNRLNSTLEHIHIVMPNLEGAHDCPLLLILHMIVHLVRIQLGSVGNHMLSLHQ